MPAAPANYFKLPERNEMNPMTDKDVQMARKEKATDEERRDFTINTLMEDVLTGEIVDHFGGQEDLRQGILRHVNDITFADDPLRVLRAAQLSARFGFAVAPETIELCRTMDLSALAGEQVFSELEKALLKAARPSMFFEFLRQAQQLHHWFPEAEALIDVSQEPKHHPEGDVWNHTMMVVDQAARLRDQAKEPLAFMLSALCHDFGKPETTAVKDGVIRSIGHETAGIPVAKRFLARLTSEVKLQQYVLSMVELHMRPYQHFKQKSGQKALNHLFDASVCPEDLLLLAKADHTGRALDMDYAPAESLLQERLSCFREIMSHPYVMRADLVAEGIQSEKDLDEALAYAHKLRLAGIGKEDALRQTVGFLRKIRK